MTTDNDKPVEAVGPLRYLRAASVTEEQRQELYASPLYNIGDAILVWVNEGDFWGLSMDAAIREKVQSERSSMEGEIAALRDAAKFAHETLVTLKIASTLREWARAGGSADAVSKVVNRLRAALNRSEKP